MAFQGRIAFLPWATVPKPVLVGAYSFVPAEVDQLAKVLPNELVTTATKALKAYVDQSGKAIETCTVILRTRHKVPWDIPTSLSRRVWQASQIVALGCLAEQRFMEGHFAPHMNASMFRPISMSVAERVDALSLSYTRRGGSLNVGGRKMSETIFQQPYQIEGTQCGQPNTNLLKGLEKSRAAKSESWDRIGDALDYFMLANAELPELDWESCAMVSAMAFEQLLRPPTSSNGAAYSMGETFAARWAAAESITVQQSKHVSPDVRPKWQLEQLGWPIRRKWAKELYELRSARAHQGPRSDLTSNWRPWQHAVISPFAFTTMVKLMLASEGFYTLTPKDEVCRDKLDALLDSDWGQGWRRPPQWPSILSEELATREIHGILMRAMEKYDAS